MDSDPDQPVLTSADLLAYKQAKGLLPKIDPPHSIIFVFQTSVNNALLRHHPSRKVSGFAGQLHLLKRTKDRVGIMTGFGIGAPVVGALVDELATWGVKRFISVGIAAGLQPYLRSGDLVLCQRACRDEGTSRHYLGQGDWVDGSPILLKDWQVALEASGSKFTIGDAWTTDAPYRELRGDVLKHQQEGVLTIDMEAAALMAVAKHFKREAVCGFSVADSLADGQWKIGDIKKAEQGAVMLANSAIEFLSRSGNAIE
jgi:uridine phosphorylase